MSNLTSLIGGLLFLAFAVISLVSDKNWQGALVLLAIGVGLLLYTFRGRD